MSKYEKQMSYYHKHNKNMLLVLGVTTAVIALNAYIVTSGLADSYYSWVSAAL